MTHEKANKWNFGVRLIVRRFVDPLSCTSVCTSQAGVPRLTLLSSVTSFDKLDSLVPTS